MLPGAARGGGASGTEAPDPRHQRAGLRMPTPHGGHEGPPLTASLLSPLLKGALLWKAPFSSARAPVHLRYVWLCVDSAEVQGNEGGEGSTASSSSTSSGDAASSSSAEGSSEEESTASSAPSPSTSSGASPLAVDDPEAPRPRRRTSRSGRAGEPDRGHGKDGSARGGAREAVHGPSCPDASRAAAPGPTPGSAPYRLFWYDINDVGGGKELLAAARVGSAAERARADRFGYRHRAALSDPSAPAQLRRRLRSLDLREVCDVRTGHATPAFQRRAGKRRSVVALPASGLCFSVLTRSRTLDLAVRAAPPMPSSHPPRHTLSHTPYRRTTEASGQLGSTHCVQWRPGMCPTCCRRPPPPRRGARTTAQSARPRTRTPSWST